METRMWTSLQSIGRRSDKEQRVISSDPDRSESLPSASIESRNMPAAGARRIARTATRAAGVLWGLAAAMGWCYGLWYEKTPAAGGVVRTRWPEQSACTLSAHRPTLLMFVHPRCPCTRSSLDELAVLLTHCRNLVIVQVLFFTPQSAAAEWARTDLWEQAARIPGVVPQVDAGGTEHRRFGARVSGEVFVFQADGELVFHGGITGGRGHAGDNAGRAAIESFLTDGVHPPQQTPVFGCVSAPPNAADGPWSVVRGP
jgi:hypothetical protein